MSRKKVWRAKNNNATDNEAFEGAWLEAASRMATPKELVAEVAEQTGVPVGTVVLHDRNLLTAGLRGIGQRGRGKSVVSFRDAANLLIAVSGSRNVKDSAKTVRDYSRLFADAPLVFIDGEKETARGRTFGDALVTLLEAVSESRELAWGNGWWVTVSLYGPTPRAEIEIQRPNQGEPQRLIYEKSSRPTRAAQESTPDLQFISRFSQVTLGRVGELVASD